MMVTILFRNFIDLFINVILLFVVEELSLTYQKAIMRTSCAKQIKVRHVGDVKGFIFLQNCYPLSGFYSYI